MLGARGASGRQADHHGVAGLGLADGLQELDDDPGLAIEHDLQVMVGSVGGHLGGARVVALEDHRLAQLDLGRAGHPASPAREHVLAEAGGMDERVGQGLHGQRGERPVDHRARRQVRVVEPDDAPADGPLGAQAVDRGVRPDRLAVGDPGLVAGGGAPLGFGRGHPGVAGVAQRDVDDGQVVAGGGPGAVLDAHPQRGEAELGVAGEGEQLVDAGQPQRQADLLGTQRTIGRHRQVGGAIPRACRGHRRDCSPRTRPRECLDRGRGGRYIS